MYVVSNTASILQINSNRCSLKPPVYRANPYSSYVICYYLFVTFNEKGREAERKKERKRREVEERDREREMSLYLE